MQFTYGREPNAESLHLAQREAPGLVFHMLGVDDDPSVIGDESFDVAIATEVIEHLVRPFNLPRFAKQLLRPGGHLIISTPYHGYLKNLFLALTNSWDAHLSPFWEGGHIKFWSYKTLSQLLNDSGFRIVRFIGAGRLPFLWKSMIVIAQKPEGSEQLINNDSRSKFVAGQTRKFSQVAARKFTSGSCFKITFKTASFSFRPECDCCLNFPRPIF
jgi:SAM-dependent methyltransferase